MTFVSLNHPYVNSVSYLDDGRQLADLFAKYHLKFVSQSQFSAVANERKEILLQELYSSVVSTISFHANQDMTSSSGRMCYQFSSCLDELLTQGGDDRLTVSWDGLADRTNRYFCSTTPRDDVIRRGSCTCTTMNLKDYFIAEEERLFALSALLLGTEELWIDQANEAIRDRLDRLFGFSEAIAKPDIVFFPSGTDSEYLPLCIARAMQRSLSLVSKKIVNIITASGEVGSGTAMAAAGKCFSSRLPSGRDIALASPLVGLEDVTVETIHFRARDSFSGNHSLNDELLVKTVKSIMQEDSSSMCILHLVAGSKTGLLQPSVQVVWDLKRDFPGRLLVVIDACQFRVPPKNLAAFSDEGCIVLITGSKFYCAPPFCGAVVVPRQYSILLGEGDAIAGLRSFISTYDIPNTMEPFRRGFRADQWCNLGLTLRWMVALHNMEALEASVDYQNFPKLWVESVEEIVLKHSPYIQLYKNEPNTSSSFPEMIGGVNSIVSLAVFVNAGTDLSMRPVTLSEAKTLHRMMQGGDATIVHLGQPVQVATESESESSSCVTCVLRIALGVDMITDALSPTSPIGVHRKITALNEQDRCVIAKLAHLARNWSQEKCPLFFDVVSRNLLQDKLKAINRELEIDSYPLSGCKTVSLSAQRVREVLQAQTSSASISSCPVLILYDLDCLTAAFESVISSFGHGHTSQSFLHCYAIKSCPLSYVLHMAVQSGLGLEAASYVEMVQALRCGCPANKVVFDSPCKTREEIDFAIRQGITVNANSFGEVEKIKKVYASIEADQASISFSSSRLGSVGIRINPLVGEGRIAALSTATATSKFGIPLMSSTRDKILSLFVANSFLTGLMCHVGSQGMAIDLLSQVLGHDACPLTPLSMSAAFKFAQI